MMPLKYKIFLNYVQAFLLVGILQFNASCSNEDEAPVAPISKEEKPKELEEPEIKPEDKLPLFSINTDSNAIVDESKVDATMTIIEKGTESYSGSIGIEFRGASSQTFPKRWISLFKTSMVFYGKWNMS